MLSKVLSSNILGMNGTIIDIETDTSAGMPYFNIVGLVDTAIQEAKERVRSAVKNSGYDIQPKKVTVNLSPADIKKEGSSFDLPIAVSILASYEIIELKNLSNTLITGELSLGGDVKPVRGIINSVITAKENKIENIIIPFENFEEAQVIKGVNIIPVKNIKETVELLNNQITQNPKKSFSIPVTEKEFEQDFKDIKGQIFAKRAAEIAAAGAHNMLMVGSPGSGKSMIAKRIITILPEMTEEEIIETTKIYSIAGMLTKENPLVTKRPFRSPHHTTSDVALIGGGRIPKPGEISLAHKGVLFLDEMGEFGKQVLEVLRQPLEDKVVTIARANGTCEFSADFFLVGASNPCNCGLFFEEPTSNAACQCTPTQVDKYMKKLSGPILDRMDIYCEIKRIGEVELMEGFDGEKSSEIRKRVENARKIQHKRYGKAKTNSGMTSDDIKKYCQMDNESKMLMKEAINSLGVSARGFDKILKVARTIADLEGKKKLGKEHILEALSYRKKR